VIFLAVSTLEKLKGLPDKVWINLAIVFIIVVGSVIAVRKAAQMNKVVLAVLVAVVGSVVGFQWIYERNEPAFMTPFVDTIAPFFPSKGMYHSKQAQEPAKPSGPVRR
jgi:hypothetical protein